MDKTNYLYIMFDLENRYIKVGISADPTRRAMSLKQNINLQKSICVMGYDDLIKNAEKGVHKTFDKNRVLNGEKCNGYTEWFDISILDELKDYLAQFFNLVDWSIISNYGILKSKEDLFVKANEPEIELEFSIEIGLKKGSVRADDYDNKLEISTIMIGEKGCKISEFDIFQYPMYKKMWLWFYTKKSDFYSYKCMVGDSIKFYTIKRNEIDYISGMIKQLKGENK